jgi:hypothetical protein
VPLAFAASAGLLLVEWALLRATPTIASVVIYPQISVSVRCSVGVLAGHERALRSADREDELRTDRRRRHVRRSGRGPGVGVAAGLDMAAMLPILAAMNLLCAWLIRRLATAEHVKRHTVPGDIAPERRRRRRNRGCARSRTRVISATSRRSS